MLFGRDGPATHLLGDDLAADGLWASQLGHRGNVEPRVCSSRKFGAKEAKCGAADGSNDSSEREELEKLAARCVDVHVFTFVTFDAGASEFLPENSATDNTDLEIDQR